MRHIQPDTKREGLEEVSRAALQALSKLVPSGPAHEPLGPLVDRMHQAALASDPRELHAVTETLLRAHISAAEIVEHYVPVVARRLGEAWLEDTLAFGAVTIASARLQSVVRRFDREWDLNTGPASLDKATFLVGVAEGEQHTLGACVVAAILRHRGFHVDLELDLTPALIGSKLARDEFAGVLLCAADAQRLEILRDLVINAKHNSRGTPVIVGGSALEYSNDIVSLTQADLATNDIAAALRFCQISTASRRGLAASNLSSHPVAGASLGGAAG